MSKLSKVIVAGQVLLVAATLSIPSANAAAAFDGAWSIQISSSRPSCGAGQSLTLAIDNGRVASGDGLVTASGRVADAGNIRVTLQSGYKRATGTGRLSGSTGSGTWRAAMCSGTWTAQRN